MSYLKQVMPPRTPKIPKRRAQSRAASQLVEESLVIVRRHLETTHGLLPLTCGCYLQIRDNALRTLSMGRILELVCKATTRCGHAAMLN